MKSTFEEELCKHGKIVYSNVGNSMMPLIRQGRDVMIIERPRSWDAFDRKGSVIKKCKRLDVPLYLRDNGVYVLHRVLKVRKQDYVLCGDNRYSKEYGITDRQIIGLMTGVIRNGREISVNNIGYRIYAHIWCDCFLLRACFLKAGRWISSRRRKLEQLRDE